MKIASVIVAVSGQRQCPPQMLPLFIAKHMLIQQVLFDKPCEMVNSPEFDSCSRLDIGDKATPTGLNNLFQFPVRDDDDTDALALVLRLNMRSQVHVQDFV